jgi:hypothetical protein
MSTRRIVGDDRARMLSKIDKSGGSRACWTFTGVRNSTGYATFYLAGKYTSAHRAAYSLFVGPIPEGADIDHDCHNRSDCKGGVDCPHRICVNYRHHLVARTRQDNVLRGATVVAINSRKTHCPRQHRYDLGNTYVTPTGKRTCRQCHREREAARRAGFAWPPHWPAK